MKYIESPSHDAYLNMALEEYVFESLPASEDYFMLWQNRRAIVVGKYQNTPEEINAQAVEEEGIQVVRRLSGGGAMYQDMGNLNFTFVVDQNAQKNLDFEIFIKPVIQALAQVGVTAQMSSRNDIVIEGKKISGNSQYNKKGRTMHHGTLLFDSDLAAVTHALRGKTTAAPAKGVASVQSRVTNIAPYLPQSISLKEFKTVLCSRMFAGGNLEVYSLTPQDMDAVKALAAAKYATWEWNYGRSPAYNVRRQQKFPFGTVAALLAVEGGCIRAIHFFGDFFGNDDLASLCAALEGCLLREEELNAALAGIDVGRCIHGMDAAMLIGLLLQD